MATQENGLAQNIYGNLLAPVNISSSTNATPVVITTSSPHGLTTGDTVHIAGHQVNTGVNGERTAAVLSNTTFQVLGIAGIGVGAATGTVTSLALGPTFAIPADGVDNLDAASVNVALEALADRTAFLALNTGGSIIEAIQLVQHNDDTNATWDSFAIGGTNTWTTLTGSTVFSPGIVMDTSDFVNITATFNTTVTNAGGASVDGLQLWAGLTVPGVATSWSKIQGTSAWFQTFGASTSVSSVAMSGQVFNSGAQAVLTLRLEANAKNVIPTVWGMFGDYTILATQYRLTGFPA